MNMLEQLARLALPKELLDYFDIVKRETEDSDNRYNEDDHPFG